MKNHYCIFDVSFLLFSGDDDDDDVKWMEKDLNQVRLFCYKFVDFETIINK